MPVEKEDKIRNLCLKSASYDILLQVSIKVVTFGLNMLVFHSADNEVLGIINVSLMLLPTLILSISREPFRRSCLQIVEKRDWPFFVHFVWLTVPITIIFSAGFCLIWLYLIQLPPEKYKTDYEQAVKLLGLGCVIESLAEPLHILSQALFYVRWKVFVESIVNYMRICSIAVLVVYYPQYTIKGTAYAQVIISALVVVLYWTFFHFEFKKKRNTLQLDYQVHIEVPLNEVPFYALSDILPHWIFSDQFFNRGIVVITWAFFKQGVFKLLLTVGERIVMTVFPILSFAERGTYDAIINLCSLPTRLILHPVGENTFFYFAQKLNSKKLLRDFNPRDVEQISKDLYKLLQTNALIGYTIVTFGISYSHLLLRLYGGNKLIEEPGPLLMRTNCIAICLMAINGITEAYAFAAMDSSTLNRYNLLMAYFSWAFLFFSWLFGSIFGSVGLVIANICNMAVRIFLSLWFIHNHFLDTPGKPLLGLLPNRNVFLALATTLLLTGWSQQYIYPHSITLHIAIGALSATLVAGTILLTVPVFQELFHVVLQKLFSSKMLSCCYGKIKSN